MSESFRVEPDGKYWVIYWGPTLICTSWSTQEGAQLLCDMLEALRQMDIAAQAPVLLGALGLGSDTLAFMRLAGAWARFRDHRQAGRH